MPVDPKINPPSGSGELTVRIPELYKESPAVKMELVDGGGQVLEVPSGRLLQREFELVEGRGTVRHIGPGSWSVIARAPDGRAWHGTVVIPPGGGESEIELQRRD